MHLRADDQYVPATATCSQAALPYLVNPEPSQGRITLMLAFKGLLRYRHRFPQDEALQALVQGNPGTFTQARHVVPNTCGEQADEFPVDQRVALFVYNMDSAGYGGGEDGAAGAKC